MADEKSVGPKTKDSKRDEDVGPEQNIAGADAHLSDARSNVFGDNTSSTGGANNPGQHGRDGGEIDGTPNNPAPSEAAQLGEAPGSEGADAEQTEEQPVKKL